MSDLTERLRIWPAGYGEDTMSSTVVGKLMREAADEIARLRAAKTAALKLADERAIEAVELRAQLHAAEKRTSEFFDEAAAQVGKAMRAEGQLASARKALEVALRWFDSGDFVPFVNGEKYSRDEVRIGPVTQRVFDDIRTALTDEERNSK